MVSDYAACRPSGHLESPYILVSIILIIKLMIMIMILIKKMIAVMMILKMVIRRRMGGKSNEKKKH